MIMMMMIDDDDMIMMIQSGWNPPRGCERAQRDNCPYVYSEVFRRDSELWQMLMTCGKLSNQTSPVQ